MNDYYSFSDRIYRPMDALNAANIALYPVDPRSIPVDPTGGGNLADPNISTMLRLAERTGGKAFYNFNMVNGMLSDVIEEAVADTEQSYTLGFYPTVNKGEGTKHSVKVRVKGDSFFSQMDVRYRSTYEAERPPEAYTRKQREQMLDLWVLDPINATDVPLYAKLEPVAGRRGYFNVTVALDIRGLRLELKKGHYIGSVDIAVVPDDTPKGLHQTFAIDLTPETRAVTLENGLIVKNQVRGWQENGKPLAKQFHIVVMDNATLKAGSVRLPIPTAE
jgi:hypothetical protein